MNTDNNHESKDEEPKKEDITDTEEKKAEKHEDSEPNEKKAIDKKKAAMLIILPIVAIAVILSWMANAAETVEYYEDVIIERTENMTTMVPENISYTEYLTNLNKYDRKEISLKGRLETRIKVVKMIRIYEYYMVDDNGEVIGLEGVDRFSFNFPENGTNTELHKVEGTFRRVEDSLNIDVKDITPSEREYVEKTETMTVPYTTQVKKTRTEPKYPSVRNLVYPLLGKDTD